MFNINTQAYRREEDQRIRSYCDGAKGSHAFFPPNFGRVQLRHVQPLPTSRRGQSPRGRFTIFLGSLSAGDSSVCWDKDKRDRIYTVSNALSGETLPKEDVA